MHLRHYLIALFATAAVVVATSYLIRPFESIAAPVVGPRPSQDGPFELELKNISPGQTTKGGQISLDADTNADLLEWNGDGDGVTGDTDLMPIPHGGRVTVKLLDAAEVTCCWIVNPDAVTTTMIGAQAVNTTAFDVSGTEGPCFKLDGEGDSFTETMNYFALQDSGIAPAGVCAAASVNEDSRYYSYYGVCAAAADCDTDGGHPGSTTCTGDAADGSESILSVVDFRTRLPAVYMACRATAAADVAYWVTR